MTRPLTVDLDARDHGLTEIKGWRCGDTGVVRYAEHTTHREWRVSLARGGALCSQYGGVEVPPEVLAWLIKPLLSQAWTSGCESRAEVKAPSKPAAERPFDLETGLLLVQQHHAAFTSGAWPTFNETAPALKNWLFENHAGLLNHIGQLEGQLEGTRLQVESRDRQILSLLQTLAETEARLPGITRKP